MAIPPIPPSPLTAAGISSAGGMLSNGVYYTGPEMLTKWWTARDNTRLGVATTKIACIGESTTTGVGSNNDLHINNRAGSFPRHLSNLLNASGLFARNDGIFADGNSGANLTSAIPQLTMNSGWGIDTSSTVGGFMLINSTTTNTLALTTTLNSDTIDVSYYRTSGSTRGFTMTLDAGTAITNGTIDANGTNLLTNATRTYTRGVHSINIARDAGGVRIGWIRFIDSTTPAIEIANMGRGSWRVDEAADDSTPYSPLKGLKLYAPHLTILMWGMNDQTQNRTPAQYQTALQTLVTAAKLTGDVIIVSSYPRDPSSVSGASYTQAAYAAVDRAVAIANNCVWIDMFTICQSYAVGLPLGRYYDPTHFLKLGYALIGQTIANILLQR